MQFFTVGNINDWLDFPVPFHHPPITCRPEYNILITDSQLLGLISALVRHQNLAQRTKIQKKSETYADRLACRSRVIGGSFEGFPGAESVLHVKSTHALNACCPSA